MKKLFLIYSLILTAFTVYLALNTFVIGRVYQTDATQMNTEMFEEYAAKEESKEQRNAARRARRADEWGNYYDYYDEDGEDVVSVSAAQGDTPVKIHYKGAHSNISITEYDEYDTSIFVADIILDSAEYLKTAFARDTYGKNITATTSEIAKEHDAILAINGDYYGSQESGYVIRNGIVYRDKENNEDILCVSVDGSLSIINSDDYTADELVDMGVWQAFCFGPGLIDNGEILVNEGDEVGKAKANNPRTAIGMIEPCHYVFVVADGRTDESDGLSLRELAEFMLDLEVITAYNLDGGGSSTMVFQGKVINNPTSRGTKIRERNVSDIVYID